MEAANKLVEIAQINAMLILFLSDKDLLEEFTEWQEEKFKRLAIFSQRVDALQKEISGEIN